MSLTANERLRHDLAMLGITLVGKDMIRESETVAKTIDALEAYEAEIERLKRALVEAAVPLEALQLCIEIDPAFPLAPTTRSEIANAVTHIRASLDNSKAGGE